MTQLRKEVRELIVVNEKIQSTVLGGTALTDDEAQLVRMCAHELLAIPAVAQAKLDANVLPQAHVGLL